jgi:hypothetical protein
MDLAARTDGDWVDSAIGAMRLRLIAPYVPPGPALQNCVTPGRRRGRGLIAGKFWDMVCVAIIQKRRCRMRTALKIGAVVTALVTMLALTPHDAQAGRAEGAGIGAGLGALVAGPVGAVVGGVVGYKVGGPNLLPRRYTCWRDDNGRRHCRRR